MRTREWLFVNGCECNSPVSTATKFFNTSKDGANANASMHLVITLTIIIHWTKKSVMTFNFLLWPGKPY
jgi:hypothetical protein